jgi:hypothetical protein
MDCWSWANSQVAGVAREGLNSLSILGAWTLWKQQNANVFDKIPPSLEAATSKFEQEEELWCMAGARALCFLTAPVPGL